MDTLFEEALDDFVTEAQMSNSTSSHVRVDVEAISGPEQLEDKSYSWDMMDSLGQATGVFCDFVEEVSTLYYKYGPIVKSGRPPLDGYGIHAEVGDDHISYTSSPVQFVAELLVSKQYLGIEISEKDTFISQSCGNYSESYLLVPQNKGEAWYSSGVTTPSGEDIPFLDIPKIRTMLPTCGSRQKHSDTLEGKVSLQAKTQRFSSHLTQHICLMGTMIQVFSLSLMRDRKFPALPPYLGGLGLSLRGLDEARQFCRMVSQYKSGRHMGFIYSITESVQKLIDYGDSESQKLLSAISSVQQHWRTWFNFYSKYVPSISGNLPLEFHQFQIGQLGKGDSLWDTAASRLLTLRGAITESELLVHQRNQELIAGLFSSVDFQKHQEMLENEKKLQRSISIFSTSFRDTWSEKLVFSVPSDPKIESVETMLRLERSGNYALKNALKHDIVYDIKALDRVYQLGPLKVDMQIVYNGIPLPAYLIPEYDDDVIVHREELREWVSNPSGLPPPYLLEDDPILIESAKEFMNEVGHLPGKTPVVYLRSLDRRLAEDICRATSFPVVLINPSLDEEDVDVFVEEQLGSWPTIIPLVLDDTGSILASGQTRLGTSNKRFVRIERIQQLFPRRLVTTRGSSQIQTVDLYGRHPSRGVSRQRRNYNPFSRRWVRRKGTKG